MSKECQEGEPINIGSADPDVDDNNCYLPIETLEELLLYKGSNGGIDSRPRCTELVSTEALATNFSDVKIQVNGRRFPRNGCPKTLVCHDFKGGYLDDRFVHGTGNSRNYVFRHWLQTDIFCYFSHKFVTIPPVGWINAAHRHGVQCIGTIITESEDGEALCRKMLADKILMEKVVENLCAVAKDYQFDGYLVNIENVIDHPLELVEFVRLLSSQLKRVLPDSIVIWYDSVTIKGELKWQDELNELNRPFFEACDGIYLNYGWNDEKLHRSVEEAVDREYDVYVGVDVFGRGCFGGGGLETYLAVEKITGQRLSTAIFAPGWSFECHPYQDFCTTDDRLWTRCANYFYFRTVGFSNKTQIISNQQQLDYKVFLTTDFNQGYGETEYKFGKAVESKGPWFNLNEVSFQPIVNCFRQSEGNPLGFKGTFSTDMGFLGGGCLKIASCTESTLLSFDPVCPLWIPLNISLQEYLGTKTAFVAVVAWQADKTADISSPGSDSTHPIKIFIELMKPSIATRKFIRLNDARGQIVFERPDTCVSLQFKYFLPAKYAAELSAADDISFEFKDVPFTEKSINDWKISCFLVDINHCMDWSITSFKLGSTQNVCVGLVSLAMLCY